MTLICQTLASSTVVEIIEECRTMKTYQIHIYNFVLQLVQSPYTTTPQNSSLTIVQRDTSYTRSASTVKLGNASLVTVPSSAFLLLDKWKCHRALVEH